MAMFKPNDWKSIDIDTLVSDVIDAVESGEIDTAFDNVELIPGNLSRAKSVRNLSKNYLAACLRAGIHGISEAKHETALGLLNAFRRMDAEAPLDKLPAGYKVLAIKLPHSDGNPDIEIYIKDDHQVLYGDKIYPRGVLTENFLLLAELKP